MTTYLLKRWLAGMWQGIRSESRRESCRRINLARPKWHLRLEDLEHRVLPSGNPIPTAVLTAPGTNLIGEDVPLSVTFSNTGTPDTAVGFGPFVDVIMPTVGTAVSPNPDNGISFNAGSATFNGLPVTTTVLTFNAAGEATHPYAVNPDGSPVIIHGTPGDQLVVFLLPFGSYTIGRPPTVIDFTGHVSELANVSPSLPISVQGGFFLGSDALNDPATDPSIFGPTDTESVTPTVFQLTKTYNGPENETVTGPNFMQTYTLSVAVANGQELKNFEFTDELPSNIQFVQVTSATGNGTTVITPISVPVHGIPGGMLTYEFNQIIGTTAASDAQLTFKFYVPKSTLPLDTGGTATSTDHSSGTAIWISPNPDIPQQAVESDANDPRTISTITDKTLAIQKSVVDLSSSSPKPGDTLQYTLTFQVSDFFALAQVLATDLLSDGQEFDAGFTPTITYTSRTSGTNSGSFSPSFFSATVLADGSTSVELDLSSELENLGVASGNLLGAAIPQGGTGGPVPVRLPAGPGTTGTIVFRTTILESYRQTPTPGAPLAEGDILTDTVNIGGTVLDYTNLQPTTNTVSDYSNASVTIKRGLLSKSVYAINGVVGATPAVLKPGDNVTFALVYALPISSIVDFQLTDYLPLPIFSATSVTTFQDVVSATPPAVGDASFGPEDTFNQIAGIVPTLTTNGTINSINFDFGSTILPNNVPSVSEVLFTVQVSDQPFSDALTFTNLVVNQEGSETGGSASNLAIVQVQVDQPSLTVTKGVVSTSNPNGVFSEPVGPSGVEFAAPGLASSVPAFTGLVNSSGLAAQPVDATLSNVQAGNLVKFAIVIQNIGRSANGAFNVEVDDTMPAGFVIPASGLNLQASDGTGSSFTLIDLGGGLFGNGIELQDPGPTPTPPGALDPGKTDTGTVIDNGQNVAVITYDLELTESVTPLEDLTNTATLENYASTPNGPNFVPSGVPASTDVTIAAPVESKTLLGTSIENSANSKTQAVIGEQATYQVHIVIPQGTTPNAEVVDTLPSGLAYVGLDPNNPPETDPGISITGSTTPVVGPNGQTLTFDFGTTTNSNDDNVARGITLTYDVVVLNVAGNVNGTQLTNSAQFSWTGHNLAPQSAEAITVIEPKLLTTKSLSVAGGGTSGEADEPAVYTITLRQNPTSPTDAYDVTLNDPLPLLADGSSLLVDPVFSVRDTEGLVTAADFTLSGSNAGGYTLSTTGSGFDFPKNPANRVITIKIAGILSPETPTGSSFINTNTIRWTSLPGDPGQISPYDPDSTERTGAGGINNYIATASAVLNSFRPGLEKQLISTSIVSPTNGKAQAVIGELVNYALTVFVPHGVTVSTNLVDNLPAGLAFVQSTGFDNSDPADVSFTGSETPIISNNGQTITYNLGDITNTTILTKKTETLTFFYQAVALNTTNNVKNTSLTNSAVIDFNTSDQTAPAAAAPVMIVEPMLQVAKTASPTVAQAGDTITYTIVLSHNPNSQTDAFDSDLSDVIPTGETFVPGSLKNVSGVAPDPGSLIFDPSTGQIQASYAVLPFGKTSTISYQVTLDQSVIPGQILTNGVTDTWTSLPGEPGQISTFNSNSFERTGDPASGGELNDYTTSASDAISVKQVGLVKNLVGTSIVSARDSNTQAVIGELVNYAVVATIPQGTTPAAEMIDQMPAGLAFVDLFGAGVTVSDPTHVTFTGPATPVVSNNGQTVEFDLGTISNTARNSAVNETITFDIQAVVLNVAQNIAGATVVNQAVFNWSDDDGTTGLVSSPPVTIIEPDLDTTKAVTVGGNGGNPSDPVTYTITIRQDPSSTADAHSVTLSDDFPTNASGSLIDNLVLKSVTDTSGAVNSANFSLTGSDSTGYTLVTTGTGFNLALLPAGRVITLTLTGTLASTVQPGESIVNSDRVEWTSLGNPTQITPNNPDAFQRTGNSSDPGQLNNYDATSSASFTVRSADLAVTKTVSNPTPNVGNTIRFTVTLVNNGPNVAHGVVLDDTFPAGLAFLGATPSQGTYNPATGVWTVGTVGLGASNAKTLTIRARVVAPTPQTNVVDITSADELDPNTANNEASATAIPQQADLYVLKTVDDPTPNVGQIITYTITLGDNGPDNGTNVRLKDTFPVFPSNVTVLTATPSTGTYSGGTWSVPLIQTGTTATLIITARVNALDNATLGTNLVAITRADQFDPNLKNNVAITSISPLYADLVVNKTVSDPTPQVGESITYTVTLQNLGPNTATNVTVQDTPPPSGFTFTGATPSPGTTYDSTTGVWDVGTIAAGQTLTLAVQGTVDSPTPPDVPVSLTDTAAVSHSDQFDPNTGNNSGSATATPQYADVEVVKTVSNATPDVGSTVTFTIDVTNHGPNAAQQVTATDLFPTNLQLLSSHPSIGTFNPTTGVWTIGNMPNGDIEVLTLTALVSTPPAGQVPTAATNSVTVQSTTYDPDPGNNSSSATVVPPYADLAIQKTVNDPTPNVGEVVTFLIDVSNLGLNSAQNVVVSDLLPAGLKFVRAVPSEGSYNPTTGIWTVGTVDPSIDQTLVVSARVKSPTPPASPAPLVNNATVSSTTFDPDLSNNSSSATVTPQYADLAVVKTVDNPRPDVGATITWTVTLTNIGPDAATNVSILDQLPSGVDPVTITPSIGTYNLTTGIWSVGTLSDQEVETLIFQVTVVSGTPQTNTARVLHSDQYDPIPGNNSSSSTETPLVADVALSKRVSNTNPIVTTTVTYTLIVRNLGPDPAVNVVVTDSFPTADLTYVSSSKPTQGTFDPTTDIWMVGTLAVGQSATLTITAQVDVLGTIINSADASSATYDPDFSNNSSAATIVVIPPIPSKRTLLSSS